MNSRTDPILAQRQVILFLSTDNSIQLEQFINANLRTSAFFSTWNRLFRSWIVIHSGLRLPIFFFVKWEINFHSMWPRKMMENPPPPLTALPPVPVSPTGPDGILNHSLPQSLRYPLSIGTISYSQSSGFLASGITLPKKPEYDPKTTRRLYSAENKSCGYGIRDCEQWRTTYILMDLASLFLWSFWKKSC